MVRLCTFSQPNNDLVLNEERVFQPFQRGFSWFFTQGKIDCSTSYLGIGCSTSKWSLLFQGRMYTNHSGLDFSTGNRHSKALRHGAIAPKNCVGGEHKELD